MIRCRILVEGVMGSSGSRAAGKSGRSPAFRKESCDGVHGG
jgi:hypothetical protein